MPALYQLATLAGCDKLTGMGGWLFTVAALLCTMGGAVAMGSEVSPWVIWPPVAAAITVLTGAAMAVDYFGVSRLRCQWRGFTGDHRRAWQRARSLERRFYRHRRAGSPRTRGSARALLLEYAQCDRLTEAREVIDYLGADSIFSGPGVDSVADALRAVGLAELGRQREAEELIELLDRSRRRRRQPVVGYAAARVAQARGDHLAAIARVEESLSTRAVPPGARRDLVILRARSQALRGFAHEASEALAELAAAGYRREVEDATERAHERGDVPLALAGRSALEQGSPYR